MTAAVSYTHLDVYKRQGYDMVFSRMQNILTTRQFSDFVVNSIQIQTDVPFPVFMCHDDQ